MIYVVLGMHKSGTTLLAQILHASGIHMGEFDSEVGYDGGNHFERDDCREVNRDGLGGAQIWPLWLAVARWLGLEKRYYVHSLSVTSRAVLAGEMSAATRGRMRQVISRADARHENWGFKDPSTCLIYPWWRSELPTHRVIAVYRGYGQLLKHYGVGSWRQLNVPRLFRALRSWTLHNQRILAALKTCGDSAILVSYERLMDGEAEMQRLEAFVGQPVVDARRRSQHRHGGQSDGSLPLLAHLMVGALGADPREIFKSLEQWRRDHRAAAESMS
jgi:hypothetical protein